MWCLWLQITSVNTSAAIRIAALAQQRGAVRNISFEDFTLVGVRGNAVDIDAYGQGDALADARRALTLRAVGASPAPPPVSRWPW